MMSKDTARLSSEHHPLGTHGLWGDKKAQLPAYVQSIARALVRSGHDESSAIQIAIGVCKRWAAGQGNVDKETRAAAAKAIAEWEQLKATHNKGRGGSKNQRVRSILAGG
jgi:hypothetical protein